MPAVGRAHKALAGLDAKSRHPHHPCYPFVIDREAAAPKLVGHAPIAIAGEFILDVLDNGDKLGVRQHSMFPGRAIVIRAARQAHGFASPSDGAASGPLITKDLSLPFAAGIRGVFLARSSSIVS